MRRILRLAIVLPAIVLPALAGPVSAQQGVETELRRGDRGYMRTAIEAAEILEIPLKFIGTLKNATGPGYDLHLVQLEGPIADKIGVAAGMSGSPVYFDGRLVGALSYRLGTLPKDAIAGVTPIEDMIDAGRAVGYRPPADPAATPIRTPVSAGGLAQPVREWLEPVLREMGFVLTSGGGADQGEEPPRKLEAGSPVGVALVRGDFTMAATGTVTLVDGDNVYAFGHPFFGSGRVELPMHTATVVHTLADMIGSSKLARVGREVGAFVDDRLPAIVGRTGVSARMMPLDLKLAGGDYHDEEYHFEIVKNANFAPILAGAVVANGLIANSGFDRDSTMLARGTIKLAGAPDLPLEMAFAGGAGGVNPGVAIAGRLSQLLGALWLNRFEAVDVERIELEVEVVPGAPSYRLESLIHDRRPLRPGGTLTVRCVLTRHKGENLSHEFEIAIPDDLAIDQTLTLAIGPPTYIERTLGGPISESVRTAGDLPALVRSLAGIRSDHRLVAVLYSKTNTVVADGKIFKDLPPTARSLLFPRLRQKPVKSRAHPLVTAGMELDGPLSGGLSVRVRYDSDLEPEGTHR